MVASCRCQILALLVLCGLAVGANVKDANTCAIWSLESGALTTDGTGNGNTLTNNGVDANTTDYKIGSASGYFEGAGSDNLTRADAGLSAGFPLKNGDDDKHFTVCLWLRHSASDGTGATDWFFEKEASGQNSFSVGVSLTTSQHKVTIQTALDGSTWNTAVQHGSNLSWSKWYGVGISYDDSASQEYVIHVVDGDTLETVGSDASGDAGSAIYVGTGAVLLGRNWSGNTWYGDLDDVWVFNKVLSVAEMDQWFAGTYNAAGPGSTSVPKAISSMQQRRRQ